MKFLKTMSTSLQLSGASAAGDLQRQVTGQKTVPEGSLTSADVGGESELVLPAFVYDIPAWGISILLHVAIIFVLASIGIVTAMLDQETEIFAEILPEELPPQEFAVAENAEVIGNDSSLNVVGNSIAVAQHQGTDNHREEVIRFEETLTSPSLPDFDTLPAPSEAELLENIDLTGTTEFAGGTEGAIDRITQEIAASLRQRPTLVVWLFDESLSLESRRKQIAERFENIYRELGLMDVNSREGLKSAILGYGQKVHALQEESTNDIDKLVKVVQNIQSDVSGEEKAFSAVAEAIRRYASASRKARSNMMIIMVTDERGDDYSMLEEVVKRCTRDDIRVYCIGNTSVFGREKGFVRTKWTYQGEEFDEDIEVDQGPETAAAEGLQIPFWTARAAGLERMSSSYGPYTLSRLCSETGGIFFVADENKGRQFDPQIMRQYTPDYRPIAEYQKQLSANKAKASLVQAAQIAITNDVPVPQLSFLANNDNVLREQMTEAQKPLETLDYFLRQVYSVLEPGEKHRDRLDSPRWRASFDLAMGRVLAMRVRAYGYNSLLAEMKSSPRRFQDPKNNLWRLEPSAEMNAAAPVKRMHEKAVEYLKRVVEQHPGTPWAYLAGVELSEPMGWTWHEGYVPIAENNPNQPNGPQFAPEEEMQQRQRQQRQKKRDVSRPKL